ncbi:MAG TPA: alpha/beta hydrolase, partial [Acinetobacter sp.]|nr:alpha/beta hydrolase [Acinetobacter sp.]
HLTHRHSDLQLATEIEDMNFFGLKLNFTQGDSQIAAQYPRDLALHLHDEEGSFAIECLIFEIGEMHVRALFKHGSFDVAERLLRYIQRQQALMMSASA